MVTLRNCQKRRGIRNFSINLENILVRGKNDARSTLRHYLRLRKTPGTTGVSFGVTAGARGGKPSPHLSVFNVQVFSGLWHSEAATRRAGVPSHQPRGKLNHQWGAGYGIESRAEKIAEAIPERQFSSTGCLFARPQTATGV